MDTPGPFAEPFVVHRDRRLVLALLAAVGAVLVWSWVGAVDRATWWLEACPFLIALPILWWAEGRFPLTRLAYVLIAVHACILLVGAHYTYEHVPLFDWAKERFGLSRNHYDRLGHLAQGFVPAIIAREILIRRQVVNGRGWLAFLVGCVCMAISACYELFEWITALIAGGGADKFLATQGDPFDTQEDMACALVGATLAILLLPRLHDREIRRVEPTDANTSLTADRASL